MFPYSAINVLFSEQLLIARDRMSITAHWSHSRQGNKISYFYSVIIPSRSTLLTQIKSMSSITVYLYYTSLAFCDNPAQMGVV